MRRKAQQTAGDEWKTKKYKNNIKKKKQNAKWKYDDFLSRARIRSNSDFI